MIDRGLIIDSFAGGGGTSTGIEWALGPTAVDVAINHDPLAIAMHRINHPHTRHYCESVFSVDPWDVARNRDVALFWLSPDCTHHSRAKGGKPVSNARRGLAWTALKWARRVRPQVIGLENVQEFADWGPLTPEGKPCKARRGEIFEQWIEQLTRLGYNIEWRMQRGCDFGAPTIRNRLYLVARCDREPIVWPEPTHGPGLLPYRTAADCIDWSIPCPSIFERKRPLAENTLRRIAKGVMRYVVESADPFIVGVGGRMGQSPERSIHAPLSKADACIAVPTLVQTGYGERQGQAPRVPGLDKPLGTVVAGGSKHALVSAFLAKHYGGVVGHEINRPAGTVTTTDHHAVVAAHLISQHGRDQRDASLTDPAPAICAGGNHAGLVAALLAPYYGSGSGMTGRDCREPAPTVSTRDRLQLVTVNIDGESYALADIGMRMLQPRELFRAQGFGDNYIIDRGLDADGNQIALTKTAQVRACGNSVNPQIVERVIGGNLGRQRAEVAA